eukprot:7074289-Prymnesium_polylepis.2
MRQGLWATCSAQLSPSASARVASWNPVWNTLRRRAAHSTSTPSTARPCSRPSRLGGKPHPASLHRTTSIGRAASTRPRHTSAIRRAEGRLTQGVERRGRARAGGPPWGRCRGCNCRAIVLGLVKSLAPAAAFVLRK